MLIRIKNFFLKKIDHNLNEKNFKKNKNKKYCKN